MTGFKRYERKHAPVLTQTLQINFDGLIPKLEGPGSSVGIATDYRLDCPGVELAASVV
jgi:hypothetical protein